MRIKHTYLVVIFLFNLNYTSGQLNHEIKLDLSAISKHYIVSYESILTKRFSIEVAMGFDFRKLYLTEIDFNSFNSEFHEFASTRFDPSIGGKYYFLVKESGSGIYLGPYTRIKYLLSREKGYVEKWEEIQSSKAPERVMSNSGIRNLLYGIYCGGKLILRNHYLIELSVAYTLDKEIGIGAKRNTIYNTRYFIKFGYRF